MKAFTDVREIGVKKANLASVIVDLSLLPKPSWTGEKRLDSRI